MNHRRKPKTYFLTFFDISKKTSQKKKNVVAMDVVDVSSKYSSIGSTTQQMSFVSGQQKIQ